MAKQITQETFDNVVLENIKEFEMTPEEAVEDAIEQFQVQGVNLTMIIKDPKMFSSEGIKEEMSAKNELLESMRKLVKITDDKDECLNSKDNLDACLSACENIQEICARGIAERCLATSVGMYEILFKCIQTITGRNSEPEQGRESKIDEQYLPLLSVLLKTFACYLESQPDAMDPIGMELFIYLLEHFTKSLDGGSDAAAAIIVAESLLNIFSNSCYMHEGNKQKLMKAELAKRVINILKIAEREDGQLDGMSGIVIKGCFLLQSLVLDDDMRVPFGHSHEHALTIVNQCGALPVLLGLVKRCQGSEEPSCAVVSAISRLVVRDEFCVKVSEMGGVSAVMEMLRQSLNCGKKSVLLRNSLQLLKNLSGCDRVKVEVMSEAEGPSVLCEVLERRMADAQTCDATCSLVASLALRHPSHGRTFVERNSIQDLVRRVMVVHEKNPQVQKSCSMLIRNIVSRNPDLSPLFLSVGMEDLLRKALKKYQESCRDEITSALRDLNCSVELRELWTGSGKRLEQ